MFKNRDIGKIATKKLLTAVGKRGAGRAGTRLGIAMGSQFSKGLGKNLGKKLDGKSVVLPSLTRNQFQLD